MQLNGSPLQAVMHPSLTEHVLHSIEFGQYARILGAITQNHYGALGSGCCNDLAPILPNELPQPPIMVLQVDRETSEYLGFDARGLIILNELECPDAGLCTLHLKTQTECL